MSILNSVVDGFINSHVFLSTSSNFDEVGKMSNFEKAGNILLAPHRYLFRGIDATYKSKQLEITPYEPSQAVKVLSVALAIIFPLLITATVLGSIAKLIGRYSVPNPEEGTTRIEYHPYFVSRHKHLALNLVEQQLFGPTTTTVEYTEVPKFPRTYETSSSVVDFRVRLDG